MDNHKTIGGNLHHAGCRQLFKNFIFLSLNTYLIYRFS